MPPGLSTGQRIRRPTAWEVSFPDELNEDEVSEAEDERQGQERIEGQEVESEGGQRFLNGKRKLSGDTNDRVRCCTSIFTLAHSGTTCNSPRNATAATLQ
jgi:hypothetical protein